MKKIAVHSRSFHADDVFAVAILKLVYPRIQVVRTRDEKELRKVDARIDVGRAYNPDTKDFDHHQKGGAGERSNGVPYASAGLIWKHFGGQLVSSNDVFDYIDERIIQFIDANDNGVDTFLAKKLNTYTISDFVHDLNPSWPHQSERLFDKRFEETVSVIMTFLKRKIEMVEGAMKAKEIIRNEIKGSNGEYLILKEFIPWKEIVVKESNLKYVISYDSIENNWSAVAVTVSLNSFKCRKQFPEKWAGLADEDLQKITGVQDAIFCHNKLFIAIAKSKDGAVKLVELALKDKQSK